MTKTSSQRYLSCFPTASSNRGLMFLNNACVSKLLRGSNGKHVGCSVISLKSSLSFSFDQSGFGNMDGEYWLGLEAIYKLGRQGDYKLLVEMKDWMDKKVYAQYSSFHLEPESEGYRLRLGTYQGNAGDSLSSHNGKQFTTLDRDKDTFSGKGLFCKKY